MRNSHHSPASNGGFLKAGQSANITPFPLHKYLPIHPLSKKITPFPTADSLTPPVSPPVPLQSRCFLPNIDSLRFLNPNHIRKSLHFPLYPTTSPSSSSTTRNFIKAFSEYQLSYIFCCTSIPGTKSRKLLPFYCIWAYLYPKSLHHPQPLFLHHSQSHFSREYHSILCCSSFNPTASPLCPPQSPLLPLLLFSIARAPFRASSHSCLPPSAHKKHISDSQPIPPLPILHNLPIITPLNTPPPCGENKSTILYNTVQ